MYKEELLADTGRDDEGVEEEEKMEGFRPACGRAEWGRVGG